MAFNMAQWLKQQQETWESSAKEAKSGGGGFPTFEDGVYLTVLSGAELAESKQSGRPQINWSFTISEGDREGDIIRDYDGLDRENSLLWLARKLAKFGIDPEQIQLPRLQKILDELVARKPRVKLRLKTKGDFQNAFIDRVLPSDEEDDDEDYSGNTGSDTDNGADDGDDGDDGEGIEPKVGMKAGFTRRNKEYSGTISKIDEDTETITIKTADGKEYPVAADQIYLLDDENGMDG